MNRVRRFQSVDVRWVERSKVTYGPRRVADYKAGGSPMSLSVSGEWGAEGDPMLQARGKIGEVAFALWIGLDPDKGGVNWEVEKKDGDGGYDVQIPAGYRVDVKTTYPPRKLIWSKAVNHLYAGAKFDVLVAVSIDEADYQQCWIEGVVSKERFSRDKQVADEANGGGLTPGTWFMEKRDLADVSLALCGGVYHDTSGHFLHYCRCGRWGAFGRGAVNGNLGEWFCREHWPG